MQPLFVERGLFVVGEQNAGKSVQLRSMFLDLRFGNAGEIPTTKKIRETVPLSTDRALYLRLTSPHETGESPKEFLDKVEAKTGSGRWCVASALQPRAYDRMPSAVDTVEAFLERFRPDRVRVCLLSPDRHGDFEPDHREIAQALQTNDRIDVLAIDARSRSANGYLLADFFDFS